VTTNPGLDERRVSAWLAQHVDGAVAPFEFTLVAAGGSNLTYRVTDADGGAWALRRPPVAAVLATAHDMDREWRIIDALSANGTVPVPGAGARCDDLDVTGAPFYVMEFVEGAILRGREVAEPLRIEARAHAGHQIADVLARIHAVDPDAVGLGELGRKEAYIERQLRRWHRQWEGSKTRDLPVVDEVHAALAERIPEQGPAAIVHGDYRLDNCLVGADGTIAAVLDWELCTLGDPLADVGLLLVYWSEPGDGYTALGDSATVLDGFPRRAELSARYAERSGRDLSDVDYYVAFGYWKLACILEGVHARYRAGVMGEASGFEGFGHQVELLARAAHSTLARAA
jgi:aminoglycoside phosphotransferase (APT) family kinase protein